MGKVEGQALFDRRFAAPKAVRCISARYFFSSEGSYSAKTAITTPAKIGLIFAEQKKIGSSAFLQHSIKALLCTYCNNGVIDFSLSNCFASIPIVSW